MLLAFLYLVIVIRPALWFHHVQPPFLLAPDFLATYLKSPGGLSQWLATLIMQSFYSPLLGPLVFFASALAVWGLSLKLINRIYNDRSSVLLALLPFTLTIVLANNYNLPFSVIVSEIFVLLVLWLLSGRRSFAGKLLVYTAGALLTWYVSGSGFMLFFSITALFFTLKRGEWLSLLSIAWVSAAVFLIPLLVLSPLFELPQESAYLWFFPQQAYFLAYEPGSLFFLYLLSLPILLISGFVIPFIRPRPSSRFALACALLSAMALLSHLGTFNMDAKKIVGCDYYAGRGDAERVAKLATSLKNYSFSANLNYVLAINRNGSLTEDFFNFFQVGGTNALHPDLSFSPEMHFIGADFYYDLGYISEARHNAYEALVYYPHSPRALQLLTKVHLITGEYKAAERCLKILERGLVSRRFVKEYLPYTRDSSLVRMNRDFMEKRSYIPEEKELSPYVDQRFTELLEANPGNRMAYECLVLYRLLDGNLEAFMGLYADAGMHFNAEVEIYEEAILMLGITIPAENAIHYEISQASLDRFEEFSRLVKQYKGQGNMARNVLYQEMGQSYLYYLSFLYPRIIKPEILKEDYVEAPI